MFSTSTRCAARFSQNKTHFGQNVAPTVDEVDQERPENTSSVTNGTF